MRVQPQQTGIPRQPIIEGLGRYSIPDESWERVQTIGDIFELVAELLEESKRR
jgi:hypothetical protein